jgi:hypothetical protein
MSEARSGKLTPRDQTSLKVLKWAPWLASALATLPLPIVFLLLFITATATDSAAVYLLLSLLSLGLGALLSLLAIITIYFYRRSWLRRLRNRLAADGITAGEVVWFMPELTSAERKALAEIRDHNPLLADAYEETLAARLTATRIRQKAGQELLKIERRINRARSLSGADTAGLIEDLQNDHDRFVQLKNEANGRLSQAKAQLQTIEAAASRSLNQLETDQMLRRLSSAQDQLPLVLEMAKLEQEALTESRLASTTNQQLEPD